MLEDSNRRDVLQRPVKKGDVVAFASNNRLVIGRYSHETPSRQAAVLVTYTFRNGEQRDVMKYTQWGVVLVG